MQILSITSQKGGVGKTTLTMNLAIASASDGVPTIVFDVDPQASAMTWYDRRIANGHPEEPKVMSIQPARLVHEIRLAKEQGYKLAIIDTPPNVQSEQVHISQAGTLVLIPVQPSIIDLDAVRISIGLVNNGDRPGAVVLNGCQARRTKDGKVIEASTTLEAKNLIESELEFPVAPQTICDRVDYKYSPIDGLGVLEYEPDGKATQEIKNLWAWVKASLAQIKKGEAPERKVANG